MNANKNSCPAGCKCAAHHRRILEPNQDVVSSGEKVVEEDLDGVQNLVSAARQYNHSVTIVDPLCQVICEIGPHWKSDLIKKALGSFFIYFVFIFIFFRIITI